MSRNEVLYVKRNGGVGKSPPPSSHLLKKKCRVLQGFSETYDQQNHLCPYLIALRTSPPIYNFSLPPPPPSPLIPFPLIQFHLEQKRSGRGGIKYIPYTSLRFFLFDARNFREIFFFFFCEFYVFVESFKKVRYIAVRGV